MNIASKGAESELRSSAWFRGWLMNAISVGGITVLAKLYRPLRKTMIEHDVAILPPCNV
ncbi:uncharacterized protein K460DRAFT_364533 [Cucurbitaria berberidis CBS 394.84]|uniref:Uncharacterized protein n=1 Tax=Cucurbitaria berberidis CBS 394.84 TaxID=1168544 RepID=A0A9P4GLH8_9PLEO|nr:uncharacterized protein K460DRAFT_364533 [Cucurbitaria berberidis CBS 394.84]KAF1848538.1 hypothetical protein K460DRAFT_364533 [Cucurbitaria berberidis CBS 394.84]